MLRNLLRRPEPLPALRLPREWPYWAGGVAIALINTALLLLEGRPWSLTSMLTNVGSRALQVAGMHPELWSYYQSPLRQQDLNQFTWLNGSLWLNIGIVAGVLFSGLLSGELRRRRVAQPWKKAALALGGGLLMGYGARLASGCNAGALLGGIPSFGLHGWVFALFTFAGVLAGIRLFRRLL